MEIRLSQPQDVPRIMSIYQSARAFMRTKGNYSQWNQGYPSEQLIREDIRRGQSYVCVDQEMLVGTFALTTGEEPAYAEIRQGAWRRQESYGTIHRLASAGIRGGVAAACFDFCRGRHSYLRTDTHEDNRPMQEVLGRYGFCLCGIVSLQDGSPRLAYDYWEKPC